MTCSLRDRLCIQIPNRPVLLDGGTGSLLLGRLPSSILSGGVTTAIFNHTYPDAVLAAHLDFLRAGAEIILTNSFGASRPYLKNTHLIDQFEELNRHAVRLARKAVESAGGEGRWVAGSIAPLAPAISSTDQTGAFREQAFVLLSEGVDLLVCETFMEIAQVERVAAGCRQAMSQTGANVPLVVSMVPAPSVNAEDVAGRLSELRQSGKVDLVGLNCGTGIEAVRGWLGTLDRFELGPYWLKPSGGLPDIEGNQVHSSTDMERFAGRLIELVKNFPIAAVGGCCGIAPEGIRLLAEGLNQMYPLEPVKV